MYRTGISFILCAASLVIASRAPADEAREPRLLEAPPFQPARRDIAQPRSDRSPARDDGYASPASFQAPANEQPSSIQPARAGGISDQRSANQSPTSADVARPSIAQAAAAKGPASQDAHPNPMRAASAAGATAKPPATAAKSPLSISPSTRPKPLAPSEKDAADSSAKPSQAIDSMLTVVGSLGIVVGLFLVTMWSLRKSMPKHARTLPDEVVEVLGRARLSGRQQMHLIRFGSKLVLAAVSPAGVDAISEITESEEVDRLAGHCQAGNLFSASNAFRGLLAQLDERESHEPARDEGRGRSSFLGTKARDAEDEYV